MLLPLRAEVPRARFPWVTLGLAGLCVAVFAVEQALGPADLVRFARRTGVVPWEIAHLRDLVDAGQPADLLPPPLTIVSSMFVHGDLWHLLGNVWFLWLFGSRLEGRLGPGRFLALFLLAGAAAAILQVSALPSSTTPMIGASGAIAGLLGAFTRTFPRARVRCLVCVLFFVTSVRLPSLLMLGLWLLVQVAAMGAAGPGTASVAWYAHVGGFVAGLGLGRLDRVGCANGAKARRGGPGARSGWPGAAVATPG